MEKLLDIQRLIKWQDNVKEGYVEDIEDTSDIRVEGVEEIKEVDWVVHSESSGIEVVEGWCNRVNVGQWEEEI